MTARRKPAAPAAEDPKDKRIAELEAQVADLQAQIQDHQTTIHGHETKLAHAVGRDDELINVTKALRAAEARIAELEKSK